MISIFAKPTYLLGDGQSGLFLQRVSSRIRAEEVAQYLGAKLNPTQGFDQDICIYVKPMHLDHIKDGSYVDILDNLHAFECIKDRPGIKAIAMSLSHYEFLKHELKNEVVLIPHHHVNFERALRDRRKITTCGYVGVNTSRNRDINHRIKRALKTIDLNFKHVFLFQTRQHIINYYKKIDIQVIGYFDYQDIPYYHPTKIINAASFGIPTVAGRRLAYKEFDNFYIPVNNMGELLVEVERLKDPNYYNKWSNKIVKAAEKYHISKIAKLYQALK